MEFGEHLSTVEVELREAVEALDVDRLSGGDAERLAGMFNSIERMAAAGKALAAARAATCGAWKRNGHRSAADWLGRMSGVGKHQAQRTLEAAERVAGQPDVDEAWRAGRLSPVQAEEISAAAAHAPEEAATLVEQAGSESLGGLRDACRNVRATAESAEDEHARYRRIHAGRYVRAWTDADGAGHLNARLTPDAYATVCSALGPFEDRVFEEARRAGRRGPFEAYAADALLAMAGATLSGDASSSGSSGGPARPTTVIVRVDHSAFVRGHAAAGESCEIDGVGPIPVSTARAMSADAFLAAVVHDGIDISSVVHFGRQPTSHQRSALLVRDPTCVVPGCGISTGLEIDHVDPWALTHTTRLDRIARLCAHHHHLKTYEGWTLTGSPGAWHFPSPTDRVTPDQDARRRPSPSSARQGTPDGTSPGGNRTRPPNRADTRAAPRPGASSRPRRVDSMVDAGPDPVPP